MGYSGSVYEKLGDSSAQSVFYERKGDGTSCMVYPQIYSFNKKTELTNKKIADTVNMLNSSSASYHALSYNMRQAYDLIFVLCGLLNKPYTDVFDENENLILVPRIEKIDGFGNIDLVSFYEKKTLEDEEIVAQLPPIAEKGKHYQITEEQQKKAKRYSCCQLESIQIFSAFNKVCERQDIDNLWNDILNMKTKCDILRIVGQMHKYIEQVKIQYNERYVLATQATNLLYHYRNKIKNGTKVFVSYCNEKILFTCEGEDDVSLSIPYTKSHSFSMLFGHWGEASAEFKTKKELEEFINIFKYVPKRNNNFQIENYFKNFFEKVDENDLYYGQPFVISISGGY